MLQVLRKSVGSVVIKVLFGLLVLSFAVWGIGDIFNPATPGQSLASAGDVQVSQREFLQALQQQEGRLRGSGIDPEPLRLAGLGDQVLAGLVNRALYESEAGRLGVTVSDGMLRRILLETPGLLDEAGGFNRVRYESWLAQQGMTPHYYETRLRKDLAASILIGSIGAGVAPPKILARTLIQAQGETRDVQLVRLTAPAGVGTGVPGERMQQTLYEENRESFRVPEYRTVTYTTIGTEALARGMDLPEGQLRDLYQQRLDQFTKPELRTVDQLLFPDEATARAAADALAAGQSFATVAQDFANMDEDAYGLGTLAKSDMPDLSMADVIFALEEGAVSEPQEGILGWYIVRATAIQPETVQPFAAVRENLRLELARAEAAELAHTLSGELDDRIGGGERLELAAAALDLPILMVTVDRSGLDASGQALSSLPGGADFVRTTFDSEPGQDSLMQEDGAEGYYMLRVDAVEDSRIPPLDEVQRQVIDLWRQQAKQQEAEKRANALVERLNGGADMASTGSAVETIKALDRTGGGNQLPVGLVRALFAAAPGQALSFAGGGADYIVARVAAVNAPAGGEEAVTGLQEALSTAMAEDLAAQFTTALHDRYQVTVNRPLLLTLLQN